MKRKLLFIVLVGLAYRELHRDLLRRLEHWGRTEIVQIPLETDEMMTRVRAAIDDPDHPSWASIRKADQFRADQREQAERRLEEEGDDGSV